MTINPYTQDLYGRVVDGWYWVLLEDGFKDCAVRYRASGNERAASIALAPRVPIPGTVATRLLSSLARCCAMIRFSIDPISIGQFPPLPHCNAADRFTSINRH